MKKAFTAGGRRGLGAGTGFGKGGRRLKAQQVEERSSDTVRLPKTPCELRAVFSVDARARARVRAFWDPRRRERISSVMRWAARAVHAPGRPPPTATCMIGHALNSLSSRTSSTAARRRAGA